MSSLDQIHKSIDAHIADLQREIMALEAARAALLGHASPVAAKRTESVASERRPPTRRRGRVAKAARNGDGNGAVRARRTRARPKPAGSGQPVEVLLAGKLEAMLRESEGGLSATTIAKRSNAGYTKVLGRLRELEGTGQVRRSGTRRTSLWRLVTDQERIAERAAELEALSATQAPTASGALGD
ncbi:MAG: hypothetical protein M3Z06_14720 [Actinomycetota bacterium]|nr:hypothetical protein [Actinomycetota bacterium]